MAENNVVLNFNLTSQETDLILTLLGDQPWKVSSALIQKIRNQAFEQLTPKTEKKEVSKEPKK